MGRSIIYYGIFFFCLITMRLELIQFLINYHLYIYFLLIIIIFMFLISKYTVNYTLKINFFFIILLWFWQTKFFLTLNFDELYLIFLDLYNYIKSLFNL